MPNTKKDILSNSYGACTCSLCYCVCGYDYMLCEFDFEGICVSVQHRVKKETGKKDAAPMEETKRQKVRQDEGGKKGKIKLL